MSRTRVSRRRFLALTAGATALGRAPAFAQGTTLRLLQWSHFIPAADKVFEAQAARDRSPCPLPVGVTQLSVGPRLMRIAEGSVGGPAG